MCKAPYRAVEGRELMLRDRLAIDRTRLAALVQKQPDATLMEVRERLAVGCVFGRSSGLAGSEITPT
jgi:hypothetical protein